MDVVGGTTPITVSATAGQLAINVADATTSSLGLAQFDPAYFTVTAGDVSWNNGAALTVSSLTDTGLTANSFVFSGTGSLLTSTLAPTNGQMLLGHTGAAPALGSVVGTSGQIVVTWTSPNLVVSIDPTYVGQTSITTLGTITTGTWNGTTIATNYGGTGLTSFAANELFYASSTSVMAQSANLTFDGTGTLVIDGLTVNGATNTITAATGNITLDPGTGGSVIVGPGTASGSITSESGQALTVTGDTGLTVGVTTSGNVSVALGTSGTNVVILTGATATGYATLLETAPATTYANAIPNVQYVTDAIAAATGGAGSIQSKVATVSLAAAGTTNIGTVLPATATIISVKVQVTSADTGTGTLSVGTSGSPTAYMATTENDPALTGIYLSEVYVAGQGGLQIIATVAGTPASGSAVVFVEYMA